MKRLLQAPESAPDHGSLHPWRFLVIRGKGLDALGNLFVEAYRQRVPDASEAMLERERERALRAPLIVAAIARIVPDHAKVPEVEQLLAAGAATHQLVLATEALGFGVIWLTGDRAYDPVIHARLGLTDDERLLGLINIGTRAESAPTKERERRPATLTVWDGSDPVE